MSSLDDMIPRATAQIYDEATRLKEKSWLYKIEAPFAGVYNKAYKYLRSRPEELDKEKVNARHNHETTAFYPLPSVLGFGERAIRQSRHSEALQLRYSTLKGRNTDYADSSYPLRDLELILEEIFDVMMETEMRSGSEKRKLNQ